MPRVLGVHGIGQQYRSGPELTRGWWEALRGGLEVAGFRPTADNLAETDVRVAFFGDLFRPQGALAGGGPPYTPADLQPGPEQDLLEAWYEAAVDQDLSLGPPEGGVGAGQGGGPGDGGAAAALPQPRQGGPARVHREPQEGLIPWHHNRGGQERCLHISNRLGAQAMSDR